ncbi:MAG: hypothetical protein ACXWIN_12230 [Burkholderiaceae bacterium]
MKTDLPILTTIEKAKILELLTNHFGASAPWILTQAQARATSLEDLYTLLVNAIPEKLKRADFMSEFFAAIAEDAPTEEAPTIIAETVVSDSNSILPLSSHTIKIAELRLMKYIGDEGENTTASLVPAPHSINELYQRLSLLIPDNEQRLRFLLLCPQRRSNV